MTNPIQKAQKLIRSIYKAKIVIWPMRKNTCWMHWHNFVDGKEKSESAEHPLFGKMTIDEKGWGLYKRLDPHLTQFGV